MQAWREGRISVADLTQALQQLPEAQAAGLTVEQCTQALQAGSLQVQLPLLIDVLDNDPHRHKRLSWRQAITHQVSQTLRLTSTNIRRAGSPSVIRAYMPSGSTR